MAHSSFNEAVARMAQISVEQTTLTTEDLEEQRRKNTIIDYKMVTFSLAGKDYAIDIMKVKEIAKAGRFTYVPNSLPFVVGVYNLRGDIIPVIDLRIFFNCYVPPRDDDAMENLLIVTLGEQTFGVVVDEIDKVVGIQRSAIQPPHPLFGDINIKYIYGVVEAEHRLYVLFDIDRIFGTRTPEEEAELAASAEKMREVQAAAPVTSSSKPSMPSAPKAVAAPAPALEQKKEDVDYTFVVDSLKTLKKFTVNDLTLDWTKKRYADWAKERGKNIQLQNEADADAFLKPFFSECTGTWWSESYAQSILKILPDNTAKNIVVWNPGCGKGYEAYSLACIMKKKYPNAVIRIYAHDIDLLAVSNAPLMTVSENVASDWYMPYLTRTVTKDWTFGKEIKDSVLFEYHDCMHASNLPPLDMIFARDLLAFLPEESQKTVVGEFGEKMKGNGIIIVGENENLSLPGWKKKSSGNIAVYSK